MWYIFLILLGGDIYIMKKKNKFTYWFDNQMAEGTWALIKLLSIVTLASILVISLIILATGNDFFNSFFISVTHLFDPGTIGGDDTSNIPFIIFMMVVSFFGILITSALTGILCNAIDEKISDLRRGRSVIVEEGHVVLLGSAGGMYTIISELIEANSNHPREALVIMDDKEDKDIMDEKINARFPDKKTTQIICRHGNIADVHDLEVCSLDTCMSVIINAETDAMTLKSILAVTSLLQKYESKAFITAVIRDEENKEAAELAGKGYVEVLSYYDVISRIIAHTGRYDGISAVYTDLFDMDGSEFYIEDHPDSVGHKFLELNRLFPVSIVTGLVKADGRILINPEPDHVVESGDRLILFAEDDNASPMNINAAPVNEDIIVENYQPEDPQKMDILVLGFSNKLATILEEDDNYVAPGSVITIALPSDQFEKRHELSKNNYKNLKLEFVECDIYHRKSLEPLVKDGASVLVLTDDEEGMDQETMEEKDAKILVVLLQLRYLSETKGLNLHVTSEMLRSENQELASFSKVNDFVVSSNLSSLIVTQICQQRELKKIFEEILSEEGSEIYLHPAANYVKNGIETDFYTACEAAGRRREILLGYRRKNPDTKETEFFINPPKDTKITFTENDHFIVIAID